jgi:hypothetical protein
MQWAHLPLPGGLYAQHPKLIDQFRHIFREKAAYEEKKRKEDEAKRKRETGRGGRVAGKRGRR